MESGAEERRAEPRRDEGRQTSAPGEGAVSPTRGNERTASADRVASRRARGRTRVEPEMLREPLVL